MSSFFDDASLVMIPSGYKTSKVYSVKPTDGTGDLAFTRSNDTATRVASSGLIEKVRTNLALYSEDFANAAWVKSNLTVTSNSVANPLNGAVTADTLTGNGLAGSHGVQQSILAFGANDTISVYAKKGTNDFIQIYTDFVNSDYANFNLNTGVVGDKGATTGAAIMTSVGDGWYRCSIVTGSALSGNINISLVTANNAVRSEINTLSTTAYVFGAQLETGDIATPYIATTTAAVSVGPVANVPRLDYLNSSCPRLLLEPQRQNALLQSETLNSATWTKDGGSVTANAVASPDGYTNADLFTEDTSTGNHRVYQNTISTSANQPVTFSVFAKYNGRQYVYLRTDVVSPKTAVFDIQNGTAGAVSSGASSKIENYGNGWYRLILTVDALAGNAAVCEGLLGFLSGSSFSNASYTGNGTAGAYLWGFQGETNAAYATSYIPTLGAAVTRGADAASKTGISSLIGQTEGTIFFEINSANFESYTQRIFSLSDDTNDNIIGFQLTGSNEINYYVEVGGVLSALITKSAPAITLGQNVKVAAAYKANDFVLYIDGVQVGTDSSGSVPATSVLRYANPTGNAPYIGKIVQTLLFKTRLTNAQLAELTTI